MNKVIQFAAGIAFLCALTKLLHLGAPNAYWWVMIISFLCILAFTED